MNKMLYHSTNHKAEKVSFRQAVLNGLAEDNGLYYPDYIPKLSPSVIKNLGNMSLPEIGFLFLQPYVGTDLPSSVLKDILDDALNFKITLRHLCENEYVMELFHGPTMAFKDVGARTMARFLSAFNQKNEITVLVATSGDTGGAVANGFFNVPGIRVVVLYPKGKVSSIQEKQFTTLGNNIEAVAVEGTFDDCQLMVKTAFSDNEIKKRLILTSANSINISRLLPQSIYYLYALGKLDNKANLPVVFSVPSGNYGNLTAGLIAKKTGLPISKFVASSNINKVVKDFLDTGKFIPRPSISTISNAMDVGNPSNFFRILEMFENNLEQIKNEIVSYSFSDEETRNAISEYYRKYHYLMDPHGAVAWLGMNKYIEHKPNSIGIFLETAHPAKFKNVVEEIIKKEIPLPENLRKNISKQKHIKEMKNSFNELKAFLLER